MDLLAAKRRATGFHPRSENQGEGAGDSSYGGHYDSTQTPSGGGGGFTFTNVAMDAVAPAAPAAPVANSNMATGEQLAAYGEGRVAAEVSQGIGAATVFSGGGTVVESKPADVLGSFITLGRTLLSVLGLATPAAPGAALSLADMAHRGAYSNLSFGTGSLAMSGASEAFTGSAAPHVGNGGGGGGVLYSSSPILGYQGNQVNAAPAVNGFALPTLAALTNNKNSRTGTLLAGAPSGATGGASGGTGMAALLALGALYLLS